MQTKIKKLSSVKSFLKKSSKDGHALCRKNADVLLDVDRDRFADLLVEAIKFYGEAEA